MATMWQTFPIQFKGGLISNLSPLQHGMTSIGSGAILQNFEPSLSGGYKKVLGYEKLLQLCMRAPYRLSTRGGECAVAHTPLVRGLVPDQYAL